MKVAVIVPTYNEKENVEKFINGIFDLEIEDLHVVVVDDNSPDGTGLLVEGMKELNERIHVLHRRKKAGLGTAYLEGFRYALSNEAEYCFEIDADFSHDHLLIPKFIEEAQNHDLVVGSRYIREGKIENWNFSRRFFSLFGNIYARMILKIPVKDLTTGYKCYRRSVVEYLANKKIDSIGYVFQIETTYHTYKKGFKVKEIPIIFTERRLGKSKFSLGIILESFWKVLKIRLKK